MSTTPSLNHWTIIFLFGAAQGVFLFFLFVFHKQWKATKNKIMATIVLVFSIMLLYYVAYWSKYLIYLPSFVNIVTAFTLILGPLFFWYIKLSYYKVVNRGIYLHFVPFISVCILVLIGQFEPQLPNNILTAKIASSEVSVFQAMQNIHLVIYTFLIWSLVYKHPVNQWHMQVTAAFTIYTLGFVTYYILVWTNLIMIEYDYMISFIMAAFVYFVGYKSYLKPELLYVEDERKYSNSSVSESLASNIVDKVIEHIELNTPYKNSDYKLNMLADDINVSSHLLSQVLNQHHKKSFNELMNFYRIGEAMKLLQTDESASIISIAYTVGFNNKVTFNSSFKKVTGQTPGQYRSNSFKSINKLKIA